MSDKKSEEKEIVFIDDTVDIGKEPIPITDPKLKEIHDEIMKKYKKEKYKYIIEE